MNFDQLPINTNFQIIMGKILNPSQVKVDINFSLKINTLTVSNNEEEGLYESHYNMFINMLSTPIVTTPPEVDSTSTMFEIGSKVGDMNKYMNTIPYTSSGGFGSGDWFVVDMHEEF